MDIDPKDIAIFKRWFKVRYGENLTDEQAKIKLINLRTFVDVIFDLREIERQFDN